MTSTKPANNIRVNIRARSSLRALDNGDAGLGEAEVVDRELAREIKQDVEPALVHAHDQAGDDLFDDLTERERHDGEVVAGQAQDRNANEEPGKGGAGGTHDKRYHETDRVVGDRLGKAHRGDDAAVGTHAHEARMAERQVARDTDDEVEGDGHDNIGADGHELARDHARIIPASLRKDTTMNARMTRAYVKKSLRVFLFWRNLNMALHLLGDVLAEQTGGLDEQHHDEHAEHDGVGEARGDIGLGHCLDDAEQDAAHKGAGDRADAAKTAAVKALMPGMEPVVGWSTGE